MSIRDNPREVNFTRNDEKGLNLNIYEIVLIIFLKSTFNSYLWKTANILLLSFPACGIMCICIQYSSVVFQEALFSWKE